MINKIKKYFKKNLYLYLTFITGIISIYSIFLLQDVTPLGKNSLLTIDFYHQYGPMLGELYDRIKEGSNLIYSFSMGMGLPFIRNFLNYLSSPFNILMFLFNRSDLLTSYSIIISLKVVATTTTMVYFLNKKFNTKNIYFIPLALLYGFCAYFTAYYWNIMWLDGMVFLPLIVLGIENLINHNRFLLYIVSLGIMLISNYFIGYMICIFSAIYFIGYLFSQTNKINKQFILRKCLSFALSSLLAGGLAAIMLIPLFLGLNSISATSDLWPTSQYYAFTFWEFLANHFTGVGSTVFSTGVSNAANISVGILTISLLFLFIINPKIKIKTKSFYIGLILFFILSFFFAPLDFIWHAFHVPNDLPYRYSFLYSFVLIIISAYSLYKIKDLKMKYVIIVYLITIILLSLLYFFNYKNIDFQIIILNFILLTLYFIIYLLYIRLPIVKNYAIGLFIIAVMVEIIVSINNNWSISQYVDDYYADYSQIKTVLKDINDKEDSLMYRVERTDKLTLNDPSWYKYFGQTTFSSMAYEDMAILQTNLGMPGNNINSYYYQQNTPIYDLMFNIKYFIGNTWDIKRYTLFYNHDNIIAFKNNNNAGLMINVNKDIKKWNYINSNPFEIQNDFINKTTSSNDILIEMIPDDQKFVLDNVKKVVKYTYKNPGDNMYFYANNKTIDYIIVNETLYYLEDDVDYFQHADEEIKVFTYKNYKEKFIINTRTEDEEFIIYVGYNDYRYDAFFAYTIDDNNFINAANILENKQVFITDFKENEITGFINSEKESTIYTSIPYDDGWMLTVNGKNIKTFKLGNSLLAFDIEPGDNHIKLNYRPKGIILGGIITVSSILICLILSSKKKNSN